MELRTGGNKEHVAGKTTETTDSKIKRLQALKESLIISSAFPLQSKQEIDLVLNPVSVGITSFLFVFFLQWRRMGQKEERDDKLDLKTPGD